MAAFFTAVLFIVGADNAVVPEAEAAAYEVVEVIGADGSVLYTTRKY